MRNALIMGAAGRDFHNFNVFFRKKKDIKVIAFTAILIPIFEKKMNMMSLHIRQLKFQILKEENILMNWPANCIRKELTFSRKPNLKI